MHKCGSAPRSYWCWRNLRPPGCKKLVGEENACGIRVGDYRVIYEIHDNRLVVLVGARGPSQRRLSLSAAVRSCVGCSRFAAHQHPARPGLYLQNG